MMINVSNLKNELINLNNLIEEYELIYLNLYNNVINTSNYWIDSHARLFYSDVEIKKKKIKNTIEEIRNISDIYDYLVDKYETLGNKIKFNLNEKHTVLNDIDKCIYRYENLISQYGNLDLSFCYKEASYIKNELLILKNNKNKLVDYKNNLVNNIGYIEEIEKNIKTKISRINIELIKEQNIEDFI